MKRKLTLILLVALATAIILVTSGCGKKESEDKEGKSNAKTIKLATTPNYKPFVYKDENGELKGYEIDLAKAVFDKLPQYKLEIEFTEWQSVLTGLDSGIYQISAESIFYTKDRAEKYYFSDPIFYDPIVAVTAKGAESIKSFDDLSGKTIHVQAGDIWSFAAEKYNKEHPDKKINIDYSEADRFQMYSNIEAGKYIILTDIGNYIGITSDVDLKVEKHDLDKDSLKGYFDDNSYTYFLLSKGSESEQLLKDVNGALKQVMEDGTAKKLSEKYFDGKDLTPTNQENK